MSICTRPIACAASVCSGTPSPTHSAPMSSIGWIVPTSTLRSVPGRRRRRDRRTAPQRVCGRPLQCKQEFEQLVTCGQVLSYVRPLKCGMHAPRAHMVFVDRLRRSLANTSVHSSNGRLAVTREPQDASQLQRKRFRVTINSPIRCPNGESRPIAFVVSISPLAFPLADAVFAYGRRGRCPYLC